MKKLSFLILTSAVLLLASCASAPKVSNISTIPEIAPGSLPAGRYIVLGEAVTLPVPVVMDTLLPAFTSSPIVTSPVPVVIVTLP